MGKYQKNIEAARRISVMQYLQAYHPGELVRKTDKEYCTKTHSSLVITPANGLFHWFSQSKGGNNALDYLVKVEGMDFVSAVRLLNEMTPMPVSVQTAKAAPVQQQTSRPFVLPPADRNAEAATAYLMRRGISPKVLRYCVGSGILYQTTRGTKSQSIGKGSRGSSSDSLQTAGRELCMPDEIRRMRDDECLLLMRSEDPVIDKKYNLLHHPNVKYTPDAGGEPYVMPPDYMGDAVTITMGAVAAATAPEITEEMYEQLDYLEKHPEENYYENEENFSQYEQGD